MASTFTLNSSSYQGRYLQVSCTQTMDIPNNRSKIDWTLSSVGGSSNYYSVGATTLTIGTEQVYYKARVNWDAKVFPAAKGSVSGTTYVTHNSGGDKTITVSLTTAIYVGTTSTNSNSWQLDNIPRKATITSAPNFTDMDNPTITFSNPANCTMNVWLEPNPVGDHLCERKNIPNTGSYTWVLTDAEREQLRNKSAGKPSYTIRIGLYSVIGSTDYTDYKDKTLTIKETEKTKPSVSMNLTLNNGSLPSTFADMYIQGKSRLNIALTAQGKYGASIKSFSAGVDTQAFWSTIIGTSTQQSTTYATDVITKSGNVSVSGSATDSRGFTGSTSKQITVMEYSKPLVVPIGDKTAIECHRSDGNGVKVGNSTSVWIRAKRSYYNLSGKNKCALQWRRKLITEAWNDSTHSWQNLIAKNTTSTDEYNALISGVSFELNTSYSIQIRAIDDVGEYDIKEFEIPTQDVALHLGKGGKNVSVGAYCDYSEDYTFYSEWKAIFDKDVYIKGMKVFNHVIAEGTQDTWKYRKWKDGTAELWTSIRATHANGSVLGGRLAYPFVLKGTVYGIATLNDAGGNSGSALPWNLKLTYGLDLCEVWVHNSGSVGFGADSTADASVYIVGKWK